MTLQKKIMLFCINQDGEKTARSILMTDSSLELFVKTKAQDASVLLARFFSQYDGIVFFCALGIAVRYIAPFINNKYTDPAIVVVDNGCRHAISLLSGHEGGANRLASYISGLIGAEAVITTATETKKSVVLGIGSVAGIEKQTVEQAVKEILVKANIPLEQVRLAATIPHKFNEPGLVHGLKALDIPLVRVEEERIRTLAPAFRQTAASRHFNIPAVAEPCALLASRQGTLILPMQKSRGLTLAAVKERIGPL